MVKVTESEVLEIMRRLVIRQREYALKVCNGYIDTVEEAEIIEQYGQCICWLIMNGRTIQMIAKELDDLGLTLGTRSNGCGITLEG